MPTRYSIHNGNCFPAGGLPAVAKTGCSGAGRRGHRDRRRERVRQELSVAAGGGARDAGGGHGGGGPIAALAGAGRRARSVAGGRAAFESYAGAAGCPGAAAHRDGARPAAPRGDHGVAGFARRGAAAPALGRDLVARPGQAGRPRRSGGDAARLWLSHCAAHAGVGRIGTCGGGSAAAAGRRPRGNRKAGATRRVGTAGGRPAQRRTGHGAG